MKVGAEVIPASGGARQNIVLLHGWGCSREVWRPLLRYLRQWANVTLLDIPGCAPGLTDATAEKLDDLVPSILAQCPQPAVVLGHSLGGNLALALAHSAPQQIVGVVTLATNPKFLGSADWPGMHATSFEAFYNSAQSSPSQALQRFHGLQASGASNQRVLLRKLRTMVSVDAGEELLDGLRWLRQQDQRALLENLNQPRLFLLAGRDALVPAQVAQPLRQRKEAVQEFPDCSHVLQIEQPEAVALAVQEFLQKTGLLTHCPEPDSALNKAAVANSFSKAAVSYDSLAVLQQKVGSRLLERVDALRQAPRNVLDLGCGTGYFTGDLQQRFPSANHLGLDLAQGMVSFARQHNGGHMQCLVGDAEDLPLASSSVDLIFSSLALQWSNRPQRLFAELARVLTPKGKCVFTTLGPHTLKELREAWAAVDTHTHVNSFLPGKALSDAAHCTPGLTLTLETELVVMQYRKVGELFTALKGIGAHNMNRHRPAGLTSRSTLQGMLAAYEQYREGGLLPATYEVVYGLMEKA